MERHLQRREQVLEQSVGPDWASQLTPEQLRREVSVAVAALEGGKLDPTTRKLVEQNLEELEEYSSSKGIELPAATAHHLRTVIKALSSDIRTMVKELRGLIPKGPFGHLEPNVNWAVDWLGRVSDMVVGADGKVSGAELGGPTSAAEFAAAMKLLTGAIAMSKAVAAHMAYLSVVQKVEEHFPNSWSSYMNMKLVVVREAFTPLMGMIWSGDPSNKAVADLLKEVPSFSWDFSSFVDTMEEKMKKRVRFLKWVGIFELALLAFDIWLLPVARPGGGPRTPPRIGGTSGGAAVAGGGVLVSVESAEALRRLVRLGVLTNPALVTAVGGGGVPGPKAPPKPMHTEPPKGGGSGAGGSGGGGGGGKDHPDWRPEPGLPSRAEDTIIRKYSEGLTDLRKKRVAYEAALANPKKNPGTAWNPVVEASKRLQELETAAGAKGGEAMKHLEPLIKERKILESEGTVGTQTGAKVRADAVRVAPKDLRYKDFQELEKALGRPPDEVIAAPKSGGATVAGAHQRLTWKFKDGSRLVVDQPGPRAPGSKRPVSADKLHVEFHGPKGERLDPQGNVVPEASISAHITITDVAKRLEFFFSKARKK